jgi:starch synthase
MHIVMVAAENGALPGAKVGGIGDVIRDVPPALARRGHLVSVVTPGYQSLSKLPAAELLQTLTVEFANSLEPLSLYRIGPAPGATGVQHLVLESPLFAACGAGRIYCHDAHEPFATDAGKFALFCQALCHALVTGAIAKADVLHLHDWHAALVLLLRQAHGAYQTLRALRCVYTIHNLSLQGVRPLADNWSSPGHWFPALRYDTALVADPAYPHCINLMRTGINLADQVHVVSPGYAREILQPSIPALGLVRGEGLEKDLQAVQRRGALHGILNGCDYAHEKPAARKPSWKRFVALATTALGSWASTGAAVDVGYFLAQQRLLQWTQRSGGSRKEIVVASIGRLTPQKVSLLQEPLADGSHAIDSLLVSLGKGVLIMLGSGDPACESFMQGAMQRHDNFLFLRGYSEELGAMLYHFCDLFLMPSTFEPCGISQMLALRAGTPPLVHHVGGLADTVQHGVNGFSFSGKDPAAQVAAMLSVFSQALHQWHEDQPGWQQLCQSAAATRFLWDETVRAYEEQLYGSVESC